jgi:hypothetical protein
VEQHAVSVEADPSFDGEDVRPSDASTNAGYDEAVEAGAPFRAEDNILAGESVDQVALTEAEPMSDAELLLQEAGRDLRPDTITPAPDITSSEAAVIETSGAAMEDVRESVDADDDTLDRDDSYSPVADLGGEASAPETAQSGSVYESENAEASATGVGADDTEQPDDASGSADE